MPQKSTDYVSDEGLFPLINSNLHPNPYLLRLTAKDILSYYRGSQLTDFDEYIESLIKQDQCLTDEVEVLARVKKQQGHTHRLEQMSADSLRTKFRAFHNHVMNHPVWIHPFFIRFFDGDFTDDQLKNFVKLYFLQILNTRQCVALALGRFHSHVSLDSSGFDHTISEMVQIVLAGLLADEYGSNDESASGGIDLSGIFSVRTHIELYRDLMLFVGIEEDYTGLPTIPEIADNTLVQRIVAGDEAFSHREALASVGLGMEWGVPCFFSLLLGGILKHCFNNDTTISEGSLEIFSSHVRQDIDHAISVALVTSQLVNSEDELDEVLNATTILMSSRFQMMSAIYKEVFGEACEQVWDLRLPDCHSISDDRIVESLQRRRAMHARDFGIDHQTWLSVPFPF